MIKLSPLLIDEKDTLEKIISSKHAENKRVLEGIKWAIFEDYDNYSDNEKTLENLSKDDRISDDEKKLLHAAYKQGKKIEEIKKRIIENMPVAIQEKCPYCMLSEPNTMDHYLDKGTFPEYSVYAKNLVPCCSKCNTLKGEKFLSDEGKRMFLSFYFDEMPSHSFLKVEIGIKDNIPYVAQLSLEFEKEEVVNSIIETHFESLRLFERYKLPISTRLSCLMDEVQSYGGYSVDILKEILERKSVAIERRYGPNFWETCMYKSILSNDQLLELMCKNSNC